MQRDQELLLETITEHTDHCGWCDSHTLCEVGRALVVVAEMMGPGAIVVSVTTDYPVEWPVAA
jgi:hypothetical protein